MSTVLEASVISSRSISDAGGGAEEQEVQDVSAEDPLGQMMPAGGLQLSFGGVAEDDDAFRCEFMGFYT